MTRVRIVVAAVEAFGRHGFAATGVQDVARKAGVTTGAIYHHFADKGALFRAAAEAVEEEVISMIAARPAQSDAWLDLLGSISQALTICMMPHVRQIAFVDAPNVIGVAEWREIQARYGLGFLVSALKQLQEQGVVAPGDPEFTARLLLAALVEAAELCSMSARRPEALEQARSTLEGFLQSLKTKRAGHSLPE